MRFLISDLLPLLDLYLEPDQVSEVYHAYLFSAEAHEGQTRRSGEPYIYHPLAVARILAEMRLDHRTIMAAILHDVIEDTGISKENLAIQFSSEVAEMVDGVSKLAQVKSSREQNQTERPFDSIAKPLNKPSRAEAQAESFRKMLMAMDRDIRVILIKLADRLHNMRTLESMPVESRRRIAKETLEIYALIAHRLGMNSIRQELEILAFAILYPYRYQVLTKRESARREKNKEFSDNIGHSLRRHLAEQGLPARIVRQNKHIYSIYTKMSRKGISFKDIPDICTFRVIVEHQENCYRALGAVHSLYKPICGKFKDYVAIPKANGYQSLHTSLISRSGTQFDVQIYSEDMEKVADAGIAAHWLYKSGDNPGSDAKKRAMKWLHNLVEIQQTSDSSIEFIENVKIDLFPDEVYVFTPNGKIIELPRGATAVDFAYAVHTNLGNTCVGVKIDSRFAPLRTPLSSGQRVEIVASPSAHPNPAWLDFVVTAKARSRIRHHLKVFDRKSAINFGRFLLEKVLAEQSLSLAKIPPEVITVTLRDFKMTDIDGLMEDIGLGRRPAMLTAWHITQALTRNDNAGITKSTTSSQQPITIKGTEGAVVTYGGKCCHPIPGDTIVGFVNANRGIIVHTGVCKTAIAEYQHHPERSVDVAWAEVEKITRYFTVELELSVADRRGVLAAVAAVIADQGSNIENVVVKDRDGQNSTLHFTLAVQNRRHLAKIMARTRHLPGVLRVTRVPR